MNLWNELLLVLLVLTAFAMLGSSRLMTCIRMTAVQGTVLGLLVLTIGHSPFSVRALLMGIVTVAMKGVVFPRLLGNALRESKTSREVQPFIGYVGSLLAGVLALGVAFWLDTRHVLPAVASSGLVLPVSFFLVLAGLFLIVGRRTAINQVLGYLTLENGIYTFGFAAVGEIPLVVELGVLLDVFVGVFVMGIAIYRISHEFDHIDSDRLRSLKG